MSKKNTQKQNIVFAQRTLNKQRMVCKGCFFIYDPIHGDQESNVIPYTAFEDISEKWICPICDAPKSDFEPLKEEML